MGRRRNGRSSSTGSGLGRVAATCVVAGARSHAAHLSGRSSLQRERRAEEEFDGSSGAGRGELGRRLDET